MSRRHRALAVLAALTLAAGPLAGPGGSAIADPEPRRVDNPYAGARVYVNPEWSALAAGEPGGAAVAGQPTGVWLDRIAAIHGTNGRMGLRAHLDEALRQDADLVQLVLYNVPGRDCGWLSTNGELTRDELERYRREFIDPIAAILADPAYSGLRIVTVVEHNSLPFMITHVTPRPWMTPECNAVNAAGTYVNAVGYALSRLGSVPNVYNYLDISHHGVLGWPDNRGPAAALYARAARAAGSTTANVHGFIANVANYSVLTEKFILKKIINGQTIEMTRWVDWNDFLDELSYVSGFHGELMAAGFSESTGVLIDTSRNGWGGPDMPTGPGPETTVDAYVDGGRIDGRLIVSNWCNQAGSGLGERPATNPEPGIDAYVWMKPPGISDGASVSVAGENFNRMCDPTYDGLPDASPDPTGALPNAPAAGFWFPAHFRELLRNAHPPL